MSKRCGLPGPGPGRGHKRAGEPLQQFSVRQAESLVQALDALACECGASRNEVVEGLLGEALAARGAWSPPDGWAPPWARQKGAEK